MTGRSRFFRWLLSVTFVLWFYKPVHAQNNWQAQWDKTQKAAEREGHVTYSGCGSHDYLAEFQKKFTKIKFESFNAPCAELTARIMAERRAGKYLHDVVRLGLTSAHTFHRAKLLQPISYRPSSCLK